MVNKRVGIGILGLGHVGRGTLDILEKNQKFIEQETAPYKIKISALADLDINRKPKSGKYDKIFTTSAHKVIENPDVKIIVESIGGEYPAYDFIKKALNMGKHVVTPNKEIVAKHGYELLEIAHKNKVQFLFETSVGSAIPVLGVISNILTSCPIDEISGILNGTTNYILDLMLEENISRQDALKKAQEMGYAEADPSKDILGVDALYKIFILSSLGFKSRLDLSKIAHSGINSIELEDVQLTNRLGYQIKLIAEAKRANNFEDTLDINVFPALVPKNHFLVNIHGADNGILINGESYGDLFFSGAGAGGIAGGSMIVSDIVKIIRQPDYFEYNYLVKNPRFLKVSSSAKDKNSYFLRIEQNSSQNKDKIAKIDKILSKNNITVKEYTKTDNKKNMITLGLITTATKKESLREALGILNSQNEDIKVKNSLKLF